MPKLGDVTRDAIVERQTTPVTQLHYRDGGQCLGDRSIVEDRLLIHALAACPVSKTVFVPCHYLPIMQHHYARADNAVAR